MSQCSTYSAREGLIPSFVQCTSSPVHGFGSHIFFDSCIPISTPAKPGAVSGSHPFATCSVNLDTLHALPFSFQSFTHPVPLDDFAVQSAFTQNSSLCGFYVQPQPFSLQLSSIIDGHRSSVAPVVTHPHKLDDFFLPLRFAPAFAYAHFTFPPLSLHPFLPGLPSHSQSTQFGTPSSQ